MHLKPHPWDRAAYLALGSILVIWAGLFWGTWAHWGNLTIDSGREIYVPAVLVQGQTLYKDVWYLYGPLGPYFNAVLYQVFGATLNTAYWAGSLSALGSAIFLLLAGMRAGCMPAGWAAGGVVLVQGFVPTLFCFPLPYSFASVYGCLVSCAFLWVALLAAEETSFWWFFGATWLAAAGLLLKPEYGMALYGGVAMLLGLRLYTHRSFRSLLRDLALVVPGSAVALGVIGWMIQLRGLDFLLQENIMSWPTSHFMRTYGADWLRRTMTGTKDDGILRVALFLFLSLTFWYCVRRIRTAMLQGNSGSLVAHFLVACGSYVLFKRAAEGFKTEDTLCAFILLKCSPLFVAGGACFCLYRWFKGAGERSILTVALAAAFSVFVAFRVLNGIMVYDYPIYYNGPLIACLIAMFAWLATPEGPTWTRDFARTQAVIGVLLLILVGRFLMPLYLQNATSTAVSTPRGTVYTSPGRAEGYKQVLDFIARQTQAGQSFLSVPEDTSLFFLSGTVSPTRVYAFAPGMLAPGKMTDEFLAEVDSKGVNYVLWSNRTYGEYGVPEYGVSFDQPVGDFIHQKFELVGHLPEKVEEGKWQVGIWRRKQ